jgi:hypothetical protein
MAGRWYRVDFAHDQLLWLFQRGRRRNLGQPRHAYLTRDTRQSSGVPVSDLCGAAATEITERGEAGAEDRQRSGFGRVHDHLERTEDKSTVVK